MADDFWGSLGKLLFGGGGNPKPAPSKQSTPARQLSAAPASRSQESSQSAPAQRSSLGSFPVSRGGGGGGFNGPVTLSRPVEQPKPEPSKRPETEEVQKPFGIGTMTRVKEQPKDFGQTLADFFTQKPELHKADKPFMFSKADALEPKQDANRLAAQKAQKAEDARLGYQSGFKSAVTEMRELTPEQWSALSQEQQRGVLANFALFQAAQKDRELGASANEADDDYRSSVKSMFGDKGGSDTYAPNTMRVLQELGFQDRQGDLDLFLDGKALASTDDIDNLASSKTPQSGLLQKLQGGAAFQNPELQSSLANGAQLLDAIRTTPAFSEETRSLVNQGSPLDKLDNEALTNLDRLYEGMANRNVWDQIQQNGEMNQMLQQDISDMTAQLGAPLVAEYMRERSKAQASPDYMNIDELTQNWLTPRS